ncbi:hypothetical protein D9M71_686760 [compost metagenome]
MVVGQDVTVPGNDEAGTKGLRFALATALRIARYRRHVAFEELTQHGWQAFEVGHYLGSAALGQLLPGTDVHHRRGRLFDQRREVRQLGTSHKGLTEQQQGCHGGHAGFEVKHRHTAPVA